MTSHFTYLPQHILSSPNYTHIIPRLMTMVLVQCPSIYSSSCNCPSQFTLSFTAAARTACCLVSSNPHLLKFSIFQSFALNPSNNLSQNLPWHKPCLWWNYEFGPPHLEQNTCLFMGEMFISSSITEHLSLGVFSLLRGILTCTVH